MGSVLIAHFGQTLAKGSKAKVAVFYHTTIESKALSWLEPEQTRGKKHAYVFTQCFPAYCRSIIPLQDTPSIKITFTATVTTPPGYEAKLSALDTTPEG